MGRKSVVNGFPMINGIANPNNLSASFTSNLSSVKNLDYASIHIDWTGTAPVGVITVEARNGDDLNNSARDDWYELDMGAPVTISGSSGDHQLVFVYLPFTDIRLVYTRTSGTGTINAFITSKTEGA